MNYLSAVTALAGLSLSTALGPTGCTTVLTETAKKALEGRTTGDQVTDTRIGSGILAGLAEKDTSLLLDVNADVREQRVRLTGTLDDPKVKQDVEQLVRADSRVRKL